MERWNAKAGSTRKTSRGASSKSEPADPPPAELYKRWADATHWRGFWRGQGAARRGPPGGKVRIIACANNAAAWAWAKQSLKVPDLYTRLYNVTPSWPIYFTATVKQAQLAALERDSGLEWELAVPLRAPQSSAEADPLGFYGTRREPQSLMARALPRTDDREQAPAANRDTIAVIDFGCPFLNGQFASAAGGTRIAAVWDQDQRPRQPGNRWWKPAADGLYGRELDAQALHELYAAVNSGGAAKGAPDEAAAYRGIDYLLAYNDARRRLWFATHGAHVLSVAGGHPDPLRDLRGTTAKPADAASGARLVFVQLPALAAADSTGSSLSAHVLDAVHYVVQRCEAEASIVINLSYGNFAGPHDGSSLIERALDDLLRRRPSNFAIVLAAGNARNARCHARRVVRPNRSALLRFALEPDDTTDTFLELWYDRPYQGRSQLQVRCRSSRRDWSPWVALGDRCELNVDGHRTPIALLQHESRVMHGKRAMALLAMAPTANATDDDGPLAEPGEWEVEVAFEDGRGLPPPEDGAAVAIDAWIERDDPGDSGLGAQPRFTTQERGDEFDTLSSLATGELTVVVGGYRIDSGTPAPYSSLAAPKRHRELGQVYGACEEGADQPSIRAGAVRSDDVLRMNGTSVAAPVVARALFNAMSKRQVGRDEWPQLMVDLAKAPDTLLRLGPKGPPAPPA